MTVRNLDFLFRPRSVAVVAEAGEPGCYADVVVRNLEGGGFKGPLLRAQAKRHSLFGLGSHMHVSELPTAPDLAVICAALRDIAGIVGELGERGTRAVIIGPSLQENLTAEQVAEARKAILAAARPHLVRILGPGSGGLVVPGNGLNASVAPVMALISCARTCDAKVESRMAVKIACQCFIFFLDGCDGHKIRRRVAIRRIGN